MKPSRNIPLEEQAECARIILKDIERYKPGSLMVIWAHRLLGRLADAEGKKAAKVSDLAEFQDNLPADTGAGRPEAAPRALTGLPDVLPVEGEAARSRGTLQSGGRGVKD